jgi:hypothetical protein
VFFIFSERLNIHEHHTICAETIRINVGKRHITSRRKHNIYSSCDLLKICKDLCRCLRGGPRQRHIHYNLQNVINSFARKVRKIVLRRLFSYRETHKKSNAIFHWQVGTFYQKKYVKYTILFLEQIKFLWSNICLFRTFIIFP